MRPFVRLTEANSLQFDEWNTGFIPGYLQPIFFKRAFHSKYQLICAQYRQHDRADDPDHNDAQPDDKQRLQQRQ